MGSAISSSDFVSNCKTWRTFPWSPAQQTVKEAFEATFPGGEGWFNVGFTEGRNGAEVITREYITTWVQNELLFGPDPFLVWSGEVPLPWDTVPPPNKITAEDQLDEKQFATYSRRQLCFIVAKSLVGSETVGYQNGLKRFLFKDTNGCQPRAGVFGRVLWGLLAACSADPTLEDGQQGPLLLVAKAGKAPDEKVLQDSGWKYALADSGLRICQYDDGAAPFRGVPTVPREACQQPGDKGVGIDFMTGGSRGQAAQVSSLAFVGGAAYGNSCEMGGGQDTRLMTYMPEALALSFFLSQAGPDGKMGPPQLRQPAWILGARILFSELDGTSRFATQLQLKRDVAFSSDLVEIPMGFGNFLISNSKPLVAFKSETDEMFGEPNPSSWKLKAARTNKLWSQRSTSRFDSFSFGKQVSQWYRSISLESYASEIQPVLKKVVTSLGTGPWVAGLAWGDSQLGLLAIWMGQALAAQSWGGSGALPVDYYLYSAYTENPGSQCLLHSESACHTCLGHCKANPLPAKAYWLPGEAFMTYGNPCVADGWHVCPQKGFEDINWNYGLGHVGPLWHTIEQELSWHSGKVDRSIFDFLMDAKYVAANDPLKVPA